MEEKKKKDEQSLPAVAEEAEASGRTESAFSETAEKYEIRLSVRELVEFILRSGDIDRRRGGASEKAMLEGSRLHRKIQHSMGAEYTAEVPLHYVYETEHYRICLDGRADGIIKEGSFGEGGKLIGGGQISLNQYLIKEEFPQVTIDEIKCIYRKLERLTGPVPVHLAQAKVYAFIYAGQNDLPLIRVRMTYCNIESEEKKYFFEEYLREELEEWFESLMQEYLKWAEFAWKWRILRQASIQDLQFPFPYRKGQKELAAQVYRTIRERRKLFIEAPTGVGKTITTIYPSVKAVGNGLAEKIFYLTAKTITGTVAGDTLELLRKQPLRFKSVALTAREKICPMEKAECDPEKCPYAKGHFDRVNDAIYNGLCEKDRIDREALLELSEKYVVCPFELSLDLTNFADMIICDYNYVFDPHVALKRYFDEGSRGEYIFLVDEAHNLVDRGRNMYSAELCKEEFLTLKRKLNKLMEKYASVENRGRKKVKGIPLIPKMIRGLERCNREFLDIKKDCETFKMLDEVERLLAMLQSSYTSLTQFLEEEENTGSREDVLDLYFKMGHFLMIAEGVDRHYRIYAENREEGSFAVKLLCVDPSEKLRECMERGRAAVLFSATLLPINYYKSLLGAKKEDMAIYAESAFKKDKLAVCVCRDVTSRYSRRNENTYFRIARYVADMISARAGNYMIFFPSYLFMEKVYETFERHFYREESMECIHQKDRMTEEEREGFLAKFSKEGIVPYAEAGADREPKSLIAFCVLGGIFSEGIDLKEDALIGSMIVGVGFPQICTEREIIKEYFEEKGYDYAYRYPGMNKVLQAAGRVIRTEKDKGVVALLDDRFLDYSYQRMFPREWSSFSVTDSGRFGEMLEVFWEGNTEEEP